MPSRQLSEFSLLVVGRRELLLLSFRSVSETRTLNWSGGVCIGELQRLGEGAEIGAGGGAGVGGNIGSFFALLR